MKTLIITNETHTELRKFIADKEIKTFDLGIKKLLDGCSEK